MKVRADFPIRMRYSVTAALRSTHRALQVQAEAYLHRVHKDSAWDPYQSKLPRFIVFE